MESGLGHKIACAAGIKVIVGRTISVGVLVLMVGLFLCFSTQFAYRLDFPVFGGVLQKQVFSLPGNSKMRV